MHSLVVMFALAGNLISTDGILMMAPSPEHRPMSLTLTSKFMNFNIFHKLLALFHGVIIIQIRPTMFNVMFSLIHLLFAFPSLGILIAMQVWPHGVGRSDQDQGQGPYSHFPSLLS
jgi:hypothetical protein